MKPMARDPHRSATRLRGNPADEIVRRRIFGTIGGICVIPFAVGRGILASAPCRRSRDPLDVIPRTSQTETQMPIPTDRDQLARMFERLGARNPESWASSQINEGIEQMHRFLFLREAWSRVVGEEDTDWIAAQVEAAKRSPDAPFAGIGPALMRCLAKGVDEQDLSDIVRGMQAEMLFELCYMLGDPGINDAELSNVGWCLVATDENGNPTDRRIGALHESVLEFDPTGREMTPRTET